MRVKIEIECETAEQIDLILKDVINTVHIRSRHNPQYDFECGATFAYNNINGSVEVEITPNNFVIPS